MVNNIIYLLKAAVFTVEFAVITIVLSTVLGIIFGIMGALGNKIIRNVIYFFTITIRAVPVLIHLFLVYYFLPNIGIQVNLYVAIIIGLTIYFTTYNLESVRGAINSLPRGQTEAGMALGLSRMEVIFLVILPQSLRLALPPLMNNWVILIKGTSYASIVGLFELTKAAGQIAQRTFEPLEIFGVALVIYFVICYAITWAGKYFERKYSYQM